MKELTKLKSSHFEGGANLTKGGAKGKNQDLATQLNDLKENANLVKLTSAASVGGAAIEPNLAVAGLLATDVILAVTQKTPGANSLPLLGYADQQDGTLDFIYSADPGAGAIMEILVNRVLA